MGEGDNLVMECQLEAHPLPEITWYRGDKRVEETTRIRHECKNISKHKFLLTLTITNPSMNDGGLYRCNAFNPFGDSNANIDLNFETGEGEQPPQSGPQKAAEPAKTHADGFPPTFTEKPRIVPNETGTLVTMKFKVRSKPKAEMQWFKGSQKIKEGSKFAVKYNALGNDEYEIMLEISDPAPENAGMYKCVVNNKYGEINANLALNIEVAPVIRDRPIVKKVEKKKSVVLQCAVQGTQDIDVQWFKEGQAISASKGARFSVEKKKSEVREGETIVQLEIHDTEITDQGSYQLVAKSETGETQSQTVTLQEEQVKMEAAEASPESVSAATEETSVKKKKKKVVKKKKKKEAEKEIPKPELSSYLKNFIKKEGESIEMKCRLEEEYEEGDVKMTWFFNDTEIQSDEKYMITFDGTYATLFIASCTMEDMGNFKVLFENKSGSDESTGKVTVKPKPDPVKPVEKKAEDEKKKEEKPKEA